jgi:glutamyl-tRNA synthetase
MLNYLVRLGWSHGDQEIFTLDEMIRLFDIKDVNQSASSFNPEKLLWINQQHIIAAPAERIGTALLPYFAQAGIDPSNGPNPEDLADGFRERAETLTQMIASSRYCYEDFDEIDAKAVKKNLRPVILDPLKAARDALAELPEWTKEGIAKTIEDTAARFELNLGKLGQPLRVAVTGGPVSPPIDVTVWLVGRERALVRLDRALEMIRERAQAAGN